MSSESGTEFDDFEKQRSDCLDFPEDAVFDPDMPVNEREGRIEVFSKNRKCLLAVLNYENNQLNGLCKFYEKGELIKLTNYENGKREGWCKEGNKEFVYHNDRKISELVPSCKIEGFIDERDFETNSKFNHLF